jgi:Permease MlaE
VITGLVVSGRAGAGRRAGAGTGAELGCMKVTAQIDAMETSAVDPYRYLAATRVLACVLMSPLLTVLPNWKRAQMHLSVSSCETVVRWRVCQGHCDWEYSSWRPCFFGSRLFWIGTSQFRFTPTSKLNADCQTFHRLHPNGRVGRRSISGDRAKCARWRYHRRRSSPGKFGFDHEDQRDFRFRARGHAEYESNRQQSASAQQRKGERGSAAQ